MRKNTTTTMVIKNLISAGVVIVLAGIMLLASVSSVFAQGCTWPTGAYVPSTDFYCPDEGGGTIIVQGGISGYTFRVYNSFGVLQTTKTANSGYLQFDPAFSSGTYSVRVVNSCNQEVTLGSCEISQTAPPTASVSPSRPWSDTFCDSNPGTLTATAGSGSGYQWYIDGAAYSTGATFTYPFGHSVFGIPGTHTVKVTYTVDYACYQNYTVTADNNQVTIIANPVISAPNSTICTGGTAAITVSSNPSNPNIHLAWTVTQVNVTGALNGSGTGTPFTISRQLTNTTSNTPGTVTYNITPSIGGCVGNAISPVVTVQTLAPPSGVVVSDVDVCPNQTANIPVQGAAAGHQYRIYSGTTALDTKTRDANGMIFFGPYGPGTYKVYYVNQTCGTEYFIDNATITLVGAIPPGGSVTPSVPFSNQFCDSNPGTFTITTGQGSGPYEWYIDNVRYYEATTSVLTYPFSHATYGTPGSHTVKVTYRVNSSPCYTNYPVTVDNLPVTIFAPPAITAANSLICSNNTATVNITTSSSNPSLVLTWTVTQTNVTGASGGSKTGTPNSISQQLTNNTGSTGSATYNITPSLSGCSGTTIHPVVTVNPRPVPTITSGPTSACVNTGGHEYLTQSGKTGYSWSVTGGVITSGQGTDKATVTWNATGAQSISVTYGLSGNSCTALAPGTRAVTVHARPTPTIVSGPITVCENTSGHVYTTQTGKTGYTWTATGATITGQGTSAATLTWNTSGPKTVTVHYVDGNNCSSANPGTYAVTVNARPVPTITGPGDACTGTSGHEYATQAGMAAYSWSINGGTITSGETSAMATVTWNLEGTRSISVNTTAANNCSSSTPGTRPVNVNSTPVSVATVSGNERFGPGSFTLSASGAASGESYQWYSASDQPLETGVEFLAENITAPTANFCYVRTTNSTQCEGVKTWVDLNVYPVPVITSTLDRLVLGSQATLSVPNQYDSYEWKRNGLASVLGQNASIDSKYPGAFTVRVTKNGLITISEAFDLRSQTDGLSQNYILTHDVLKPGIASVAEIDLLTRESVSQNIRYFDGLGRPIQTVSTQGSPAGNDLVQPIVYDDFGREARKYLPFAAGSDGWYKNNEQIIDPVSHSYAGIAAGFYDNPSGKIADDQGKPYAETIFESSPLNRAIEQGAPGQAWQPDIVNTYESTDHTVKFAYGANGASEVLLWAYTSPTATYPLGIVNADQAGAASYYEENKLHKKKTKDENYNEVIEYVDLEGRVLLKRVQAVPGAVAVNDVNYASTYYIYDDFGRLATVIPPEATRLITKTPSDYIGNIDSDKNAFLSRWAFRYAYDARGRMTMKQVPGAEPVFMVYDNRDRLVMTQDGVQRNADKWSYTKYDELNRPIITGIYTHTDSSNQAQMSDLISTSTLFETFNGASPWNGYTNTVFPITGVEILTITYYDNYDFMALWPDDYRYTNDALTETINGVQYGQPGASDRTTGFVTGAYIKVLNPEITGGRSYLKSVSYYDDKYRLIQTIADNGKGGIDRVSNLYDFTGKVIETKTIHYTLNLKSFVNARSITNDLYKTSGSNSWNAGASSVEMLPANADGWVEFRVPFTTKALMVGMSESDPDAVWTSIDYALYVENGGTTELRESGSNAIAGSSLSYLSNTVFRIERKGSVMHYYKNGTEVLTRPCTTAPLLIDISLHTINAQITDIKSSFGKYYAKTITRKFEYDHAGRLLKTWHQIDALSPVLLGINEYNELGQLVDKHLNGMNSNPAQVSQSVDYRYSIRGWLTSINDALLESSDINDDTNGSPRDLFGMNLHYTENTGIDMGGTIVGGSQFNGNISAITWSNQLGLADVKRKEYVFDYDAMNRLEDAIYHDASFVDDVLTWNAASTGKFREGGITYDLNGNIKSLNRTNGNFEDIDVLSYDYGSATTSSNRLRSVTDSGNDKEGFREFNSTEDDYVYDSNGNMVSDRNKGGVDVLADRNGDFENGSSQWTTGGATSRLSFSNGEMVVTAGTASVTLQQLQVVVPNKMYVIVLDMTRTSSSGSITIRAGNGVETLTGSGERVLVFTAGSGTDLRLIPTATFAGTIRSVTLRGLTVISYNHLNLPQIVTQAGGQKLTYIYDATGRKLSQIVSKDDVTIKKSDYNGEFFYENDSLKFINHEEGRIVMTDPGQPEYQYHLKDHLGNVRLTFTTKQETESATATMDNASEEGEFLYYDEAVKINHTLFDRTYDGTTGPSYYATRLSGGTTDEIFGLAKSLSVMPGDTVKMEVYAKYIDNETGNWEPALSDLMALVASQSSSVYIDGGVGGSIGNHTFPYEGLLKEDTVSVGPKAYLNWIITDRNANPIDMGYKRLSAAPKEHGQNVAHEPLASEILIREPGYVYIYLSNENEDPVEVYFDDFKVEHVKSSVISMQDYYPFGSVSQSYQRESSDLNRFLFQGKELQTDLDLGVYNFHWRQYDPTTGRTTTQDPHADFYGNISPYSFLANNPVLLIDPTGMDTDTTKTNKSNPPPGGLPNSLHPAPDQDSVNPPDDDSSNGQAAQHSCPPSFDHDYLSRAMKDRLKAAIFSVGVVESNYAIWENNYDHVKYPTTKGTMKPIYKSDGTYRSARAAQFGFYSKSVKNVGFGLSLLNLGLSGYEMRQQITSGQPIDPMNAAQFGVGSVGFFASLLNYLGIGGRVTSTISATAGVFGMALSAPGNWYNVYRGAYDLQYASTPYYPSDSEIFGGN